MSRETQAAWRKKQRAKGLTAVTVWVPFDKQEAVKAIATEYTAQMLGPQTESQQCSVCGPSCNGTPYNNL